MTAIRTEEDEVKVITTTNGSAAPEKGSRPDLVKEVNLRIPLHIAVPVAALVFVAIVSLLFGLFLLKLPKEHAPAVALALGVNILAATTFAASRRKLSFATVVELCALVIYPVALAVILVNLGAVQPTEEASAAPAAAGEAAAESSTPIELTATNLEFSESELTFPADEEVVVAFDNPDSAPHNLAIYADDTLDEDFFVGQNVEPGASTEYEIPALEEGAYYFQCDLHPTMNGRVIVE
jgi:plastocyanin